MALRLITVIICLCSLAAFAKGPRRLTLDGVVTAIQGNTMTVGDARRGPCLVVVQDSTEFKTGKRPRGLAAFTTGDAAHVEGIPLSDGRILALRIDLRPKKPAPALNLTNLNRDGPVPQFFNVQGQTAPDSVVLVTVRSLQTNQSVKYQGWSKRGGHFDVPVQASTKVRGERLEVSVESRDPNGTRSGPVVVQLVRQ